MKKLLILLFSVMISFNSYGLFGLFEKTVCVETDSQERDGVIYLLNKTKPFSGKNLCKYENGQNKSKGIIKDGKWNGKATYWYKKGQIKFERTYKFGQIEREKNYQNGELIGLTHYQYNENGQIEKVEYYKDNQLSGETEYIYFVNGQMGSEVNYKDGKLDGKQTYWSENGQIQIENNYKDDECISGDWC